MRRLATIALAGLAFTLAPPTVARDVFQGDGTSRVEWRAVFSSPDDDWINDLVPLGDGSFLAVGFLGRNDAAPRPTDWRALAARLAADGSVLARHEYGAGGGIDAFWAAQPSADGRIAFSGFTTRIGAGGIDAWTLLAERDGTIARENAFGGRGYDRATDIAAADDGGFLLVGQADLGGASGFEVLVVKTDAGGIEQWRRTYGGPGRDRGFYIERTPDGAYVLAGGTGTEEDAAVFALKIDAEGRELWRRVVDAPGGNDVNHGLAVHPDGRILLVGYTQSWGARVHDMLAITLAEDGRVLTHEVFGGRDDDRVMMGRIDASGRAWLVGYTRSLGAGDWDLFLARLDRDGRFEPYVTRFGGPADDHGTTVLPLADGSLLLGGYAQGLDAGGQDAFVMRITAPEWMQPTRAMRKRRIATE